jgi:hypothetical protein
MAAGNRAAGRRTSCAGSGGAHAGPTFALPLELDIDGRPPRVCSSLATSG